MAAAAPAIAVAITFAAVLGIEFVWLARSYRASGAIRPTTRALLCAWCVEVTIAQRAFLWNQPFRSRQFADVVTRPAGSDRRGLVLVHGYACNRGFWIPWLARLRRERIPFVAVTMEPAFGSIDRYTETIAAAVRRLAISTGEAPIVVAHSMGGLAVRRWLCATGDPEAAHRIVTIGTPHRGTWLARHGIATNAREMRIDSVWLARLSAAEPPEGHARFICYWSRCDNVVFPTSNATLPDADNREVDGVPHVRLAFDPRVIDEILDLTRPQSTDQAEVSASTPRLT